MLIIRPISIHWVVAMVLVQIVVVLCSLMMTIEVLWSLMMPMMMSLMMPIEVQVALVRTRSGTVLCLLENGKMKKIEHDFVIVLSKNRCLVSWRTEM